MKERDELAEKPGQTECKVTIFLIFRIFLFEVITDLVTRFCFSSCIQYVAS